MLKIGIQGNGVKVFVFVIMMLFIIKTVFLFSVNVFVFIPVILFYCSIFLKVVKNGYTRE